MIELTARGEGKELEPASLTCVGLSYRTAPLALRERISFTAEELPHALRALRQYAGPCVIVTTCNRTEVYVHPARVCGHALVDFLCRLKDVPLLTAASAFYILDPAATVGHLFRVASGLDSMVVGEAEILSQVRGALAQARQAGTLDGVLSRLFHQAVAVGRRVRRQAALGQRTLSVSSAAVALARQTLGQLAGCTALVISTGAAGNLAARALRQEGAHLLITSRTYRRAADLARSLGGQAVPFPQLTQALAQADLVVSSSGANSFILGPQEVAPAMAQRPGRPLLLIDIAIPRDIDPQVQQVPGVTLFNIDDVKAVCQSDSVQDVNLDRARELLWQEEERFLRWWRSRASLATVAALHRWAEGIRQAELAKTASRLSAIKPEEQQRLEAMTRAIVKKLLHRPIHRLRSGDDCHRYAEAVRYFFPLEEQDQQGEALLAPESEGVGRCL